MMELFTDLPSATAGIFARELSVSMSSPTQGPSSSMTMPVISSPVSGIDRAGVPGRDWKLAMTPENIKPLLENARAVRARLWDCVEELGRLKEMVVISQVFWCVLVRIYPPRSSRKYF